MKSAGIVGKRPPQILYICKPEAGCQGKGIFITRKLEDLREQLNGQLQEMKEQWDEYIKSVDTYTP